MIREGNHEWLVEALYALEKPSEKDGQTCLHLAIDLGNLEIFNYLVGLLKVRDHMRGTDKNKYWDLFKPS